MTEIKAKRPKDKKYMTIAREIGNVIKGSNLHVTDNILVFTHIETLPEELQKKIIDIMGGELLEEKEPEVKKSWWKFWG